MPRKAKKNELDLVHLTPNQVQDMKRDIDQLEKMLRSDRASGRPKIQDEGEFRSVIDKKKKILADHAPKKFRGEKANRMLKLARELETKITDAMPKTREYYQRYPKGAQEDFDFERTVQQQMAFMRNKELQGDIRAYKHIMRRIDPDDPTLTNIERLRR